ncbi:hypothetical protein QN366_01440 [Pseudomonas sp. CCC3.2]|uniref:hypothetical protein n=1 Tax=unclassified Pseudomonas TaxID=196821 RepID=UPI002AB3EFA4|nr:MULTISPECIES: hypothetical protein [unclassified Pseudomonas]MDY7560184.1 hypothetical protein [Pseudomonas sp. AB6]MEB0178733.1 hypothetical protein [Pseudomonas sp. CCC3.2]MEB0211371.1 hypothetical protein [Pseudomonas sp. AB6]
MHPKNTTGHNRMQHLSETQPINFNDAFMDCKPPCVSRALTESSTLLSSGIALITQLSAVGPVDEDAAFGIIFIITGAKALLDSTEVAIRQASEQGGAQ